MCGEQVYGTGGIAHRGVWVKEKWVKEVQLDKVELEGLGPRRVCCLPGIVQSW